MSSLKNHALQVKEKHQQLLNKQEQTISNSQWKPPATSPLRQWEAAVNRNRRDDTRDKRRPYWMLNNSPWPKQRPFPPQLFLCTDFQNMIKWTVSTR